MTEEKELTQELLAKLKSKNLRCLPSKLYDVFGKNLENDKATERMILSPRNEFLCNQYSGPLGHFNIVKDMSRLEINKNNLQKVMSLIEKSAHYALSPSAKIYTRNGVVPVQPDISYWYNTKIENINQLLDPDFAHILARDGFKPCFIYRPTNVLNTTPWTPFRKQIENTECNIKKNPDQGLERKLTALININKCFLKSVLQIINEQ